MSVRPRINVTSKEWELFVSVFPDFEQSVKKLYSNFNAKDLPDYSKSYLLFLSFTESELLQSLLFNPNMLLRLKGVFPEEVKKFAGVVKNSMKEKDTKAWDKFCDEGALLEYPEVTQKTATSTLHYILSKEKLTQFSDQWQIDKTFKISSLFLFNKLCLWLKTNNISFSANYADDTENTLWYDYSITIS